MSNFKDAIKTPLEMARHAVAVHQELKTSSLPEYTASTRLNPVVLIDKQLTVLEDTALPNILQTMGGIFAAHYLQAVKIATSGDLRNVDTIKLLDQFSTDRDLSGGSVISGLKGWGVNVSTESADCKLQMDWGMEAKGDAVNDVQAHVNLAIGRLLHVTIGVGDAATTIPVSLVLNPRIIASNALPNVLSMNDDDTTFMGRYHKWRSGEIESFLDYALALDIIEKDKKALLSDGDGLYTEARAKKTRGFFSTILSDKKSMNTASTMAVISKSTAEELELALRGKLKKSRTREKYFKDTNSMMLVVVDMRAERLKIYQRGISDHGIYTFGDIEDNSKKSGAMDISSILKAYKLGDAPSL